MLHIGLPYIFDRHLKRQGLRQGLRLGWIASIWLAPMLTKSSHRKQHKGELTGLIENNPKNGIDNPTAERLLKAFDEITLTTVRLPNRVIQHITPLTTLQSRILELLENYLVCRLPFIHYWQKINLRKSFYFQRMDRCKQLQNKLFFQELLNHDAFAVQ